jgi:serine/threonine protein kinase/Tol biopolymer transport system component
MPLPSSTKLGPYEILAPHGAGGMGEVYRARDTRLDRVVAIKILPSQFSADAVHKQRFEREAKVISRLNHPHICVLYDIGQQDGIDYLVMEFVEGETLAKRLEKGPLPLEQVLRTGAQIAEALDKAHRNGIAHRDLKPGNIMLTAGGAKLLDFGLAKPVVSPLANLATMTETMQDSPVTEQGTIVGTFQYMSPEQLEGKEVDGRSDIFSLGAVLYEMLTGKRAFEGKSRLSIASAILEKEPPPLSSIKPVTPPALDYAVKKCLAKDPDERWQNASDLASQLKWIGEGSSEVASLAALPSRRRWRELRLGGLSSVFILATLILAYAYIHRHIDQPAPLAASILPPPNTAFFWGFALSPDGTRLAFAAQSVEGKRSLWVRQLKSLVAQELSGTGDASFPFWSPDSQWLGFFAGEKLKKIPADGGAVQEICDASIGRGGTWNSRGVIVFAPSGNSPIFRVSAGGGTSTPVTQLDPATGETTHRWPGFLPDGVHFLYLARQTSEKLPAGVYVGSLDGSLRKKVLDGPSDARYVEPGYLLFVRNTTLFAQRFALRDLKVEGEEIPIVSDVQRQAGMQWAGVDVSPMGQILYRSTGYESDNELIVSSRSGKLISPLPVEGSVAYVSLSPDGQKLAVSVLSGSAHTGLWVYDLVRQLRTPFTFSGGGNVTWSPDGSQLAFFTSRTGPFNMYLKPANGTGEEKAIHASPDDERPQSFSPDGRYLVYERRPTSRLGIAEIMILPLTGEQKPYSWLNAPYANWGGQVSPDGRWIAFVSGQTGRNEVYVSTFPQVRGTWPVSTTGGRTPRWQRDGRTLYYARPDGALIATEVTPGKDSFSVGTSVPIPERHLAWSAYDATYAVFPDGQRFVAASIKEGSLHAPLTLLTNGTTALKP